MGGMQILTTVVRIYNPDFRGARRATRRQICFDGRPFPHYDNGMNEADFVFRGDLSQFLPLRLRGEVVRVAFEDHQTVKHLIESLGIPHVEIGEILANRAPVGPAYRPGNEDRIEVRPPAPGCSIEPRFVLDNHLGRLAASLRMLGFDCLYQNDFEDSQMAGLLADDPRILLTRDRRLLMRNAVQFGYCVRSLEPDVQLREVVRRFDLSGRVTPFRRCLRCNSLLQPVAKVEVLDRLEPKTKLYYDEFRICRTCDQVYWKGSHFERMQELVAEVSSQSK